jgi:hypothetical protein
MWVVVSLQNNPPREFWQHKRTNQPTMDHEGKWFIIEKRKKYQRQTNVLANRNNHESTA